MDSIENEKNWQSHPFSLRKWFLQGFKSVKQKAEIELSPMTIVVGENSAGKSTLIQSILFMAQNSQSEIRGGKNQSRGNLDLNGSLVALGDMKETICDLNEVKNRSFGIGGVWVHRDFSTRRMPGTFQSRRDLSTKRIDAEMQLEFFNEFVAEDENEKSSLAVIGKSTVNFFINGSGSARFISERSSRDLIAEDLQNRFPETYSPKHKTSFGVHPEFETTKENFMRTNNVPLVIEENECLATLFMGGLPLVGLKKRKSLDYLLEAQKELFMESLEQVIYGRWERNLRSPDLNRNTEAVNSEGLSFIPYDSKDEAKRDFLHEISIALEKIVRLELALNSNTVSADGVSIDDFNAYERQLLIQIERIPKGLPTKVDAKVGKLRSPIQHEQEMREFWSAVEEEARRNFAGKLSAEQEIMCFMNGRRYSPVRSHSSSMSRNTIDQWNRYISNRVLYLGPLRELPKAAYGLETTVENPNIPLGSRGEFWARKIHQDNRNRMFPRIIDGELKAKKSSLEDAVSYWLSFVEGLPEGNSSARIEVNSPTWFGYAPRIGNRTPSAIGVGVTQVLPVIQLCLMALPGDLILLEQPELHLNPAMQQRLAEFLLTMVKSGRQIIVETHSEYLITRLRRLAATNKEDKDFFSILFVERDSNEGTNYRTVNVNNSGEFSEWPTGFFDQVTDDLKVLMQASLKRTNPN